jgi:FlaA1/EpsC-like NDP-sugar epimerase
VELKEGLLTRKTGIIVAVAMTLSIIVLSAVGVALAALWDSPAPLSAALPAVAIVSFVGVLIMTQKDEQHWEINESSLRAAIASSVVITYLVLVGIVAFFVAGPTALPQVVLTMLTNFTTVVGVVIASYFGASAYVQGRSKDQDKVKDKDST